MKRGLLSLMLAFGLLIAPATALQAGALSQIFGTRANDSYSGAESITSVQDPVMPADAVYAAGPVGISDLYTPNAPFVEGGTIKEVIGGVWVRRPYYSWNNGAGGTGFQIYPGTSFTPASYQKYSVYPSGVGNNFVVRWCAGPTFTTCTQLTSTAGLLTGHLAYAVAGGEGGCFDRGQLFGCPIGYINTTQNRFLRSTNQTWYAYCYTSTVNNVIADFPPGTISACGPYPQPDWNVNYH